MPASSFASTRNTLRRTLLLPVVVIVQTLSVFFAFSFLSGCVSSGKPPVKESTRLSLTIQASNDVNPNKKGAAPVMVRIYELKADKAFLHTDYFSLYHKDREVLGSDLLARDEIILRPGDTFKLTRLTSSETVAIGVVAGFRNLSESTWRAVYKLPDAPDAAWYRVVIPDNKVNLLIRLDGAAIQLMEQKN